MGTKAGNQASKQASKRGRWSKSDPWGAALATLAAANLVLSRGWRGMVAGRQRRVATAGTRPLPMTGQTEGVGVGMAGQEFPLCPKNSA